MASAHYVLDLNPLYSDSFAYSLPRGELEKYFSGKAFDHQQEYTEEERTKLSHDIVALYQKVVPTEPLREGKLEAVMTAGGPGVGKTLLLRKYVEELKYPYICPDDVCLKNQTETYLAEIALCDMSREARQELYNKWRPGSNAANHLILAHLIHKKYPFCFGTTSSGPFTYKLLECLKKQGYAITLLHVTSPSDICWKSLQERDKTFIQTTERDVVEKAKLVPQRITDTFLKYATTIKFYYRDTWDKDATLAATWIRNVPDAAHLGSLEIVNELCYEAIKNGHNTIVEQLHRPELLWENTVELNSQRVSENSPVSVS